MADTAHHTCTRIEDVRDMFFPGTPLAFADAFASAQPHDKIVVHIPARANSTRIGNKNIRPLNGLPLLAYTVLMARAMGADRIILNTDSEAYCRVGEMYGAECPFVRPAALSGNATPPGLASYYAARMVLAEGYPAGYWIDMYPTSPLRSLATMRRFLHVLKKAGTCVSANAIPTPATQVYLPERGTAPVPLQHDGARHFYKPTGSFVGQHLDHTKRFWKQYEAITDPLELLDIDTEDDWNLAETVLREGHFDFGVPIP